GGYPRSHQVSYPPSIPLSAPDRGRRFVERALQDHGSSPLSTVQVEVPAGHREAVGLANDVASDHGDGEVQGARKPLDDDKLLRVLAAEIRPAGSGDVEELGDDGGDTVEVTGPCAAAQLAADLADRDPERIRVRIHLVHVWMEDDVNAFRFAQREVAVEVARVRREVLVRAEL